MPSYNCVAMLLAGGEGKRLGPLTRNLAKPAVSFGGKYRIIDFTLSNCANSGIDTIGILTQYQPLVLNSYIGIGNHWDLDRRNGGVTILPPYVGVNGIKWYKGTANSIYQNIPFIEQYNPQYILVISGDHIYKMNYLQMLEQHIQTEAEITIAANVVSIEEASRFGIIHIDEALRITDFVEKPAEPTSNLASMGVYIFNWDVLKHYLIKDEQSLNSSNDFGKDVIPLMLKEHRRMYVYAFSGYWKDVGTIESLWQANMDLLEEKSLLNLNDSKWRIYSANTPHPPHFISAESTISQSLINEGCIVYGSVLHSVLFYGVHLGKGSVIKDSVIMPHVKIGTNVQIEKAIIGEELVIPDGTVIKPTDGKIALIEGEIANGYEKIIRFKE